MPELPRARWLRAAAVEAAALPGAIPALEASLAAALARTEDQRFAAAFARACPTFGATVDDYLHRVEPSDEAGLTLVGIRMLGGDTRRPFVELLAWERLPEHDAAWTALRRHLLDRFGVFHPRALRVRLAAPPPTACDADMVWVAAPLATLQAAPRPAGAGSLRLVAADASDAARLAQEVSALHRERPALAPHVHPASAEDLAACARDGVALRAEVDGRWAGVVAARAAGAWALRGYEVVEELLAAGLRGRGLGPVLQRGLIDALPAAGDALLWGTIHADNAPSRATARRCGRIEVATSWFVPAAPP